MEIHEEEDGELVHSMMGYGRKEEGYDGEWGKLVGGKLEMELIAVFQRK